MELRNLSTFLAVAEKKSFVQAAMQLHLSQPAITAQIQRLEEELGVQLLDRNRRSVRTTAAGEAFLAGARITLEAAQEAAKAAQRAASKQTARLRFGFPPSVSRDIVPNIMTEFHKLYPHVKLDLFSYHTSTIVSELQRESLDLGFVRLPVCAKGLQVVPAHQEPLVVCLPKDHSLCNANEIRFEDLANERFIVYGRRWAPGFHDRFMNHCIEAGFAPTISMVIGNPTTNVCVRDLPMSALRSELGIATRTLDHSAVLRTAWSISRAVCKRLSAA
jgi:DNA-binding transcriptional LysR family regulator